MEAKSENYFCPYCQSHYQAEAYEYKLARFFIEGAFLNFHYALFFFIPIFFMAILQMKGILGEREIFTTRLIDSLARHPEILLAGKNRQTEASGVICHNLTRLQFQQYERKGPLEIVECLGKVDALYLKGSPGRVRRRERRKILSAVD
ncbi:MAG: hypothetical protein PT957_00590 [Firmicutes bacterium]|nr:hypothetical protein [Bacillota bacterium]